MRLVLRSFLPVMLLFSTPNVLWAGGFEKSVLWSGRYGSLAGAVTSDVAGPEALYFNPAGLVGGEHSQLAVNFSPTWSVFSGPIGQDNVTLTSGTEFYPIYGIFYSQNLNRDFALGVGAYVSGGSRAIYKNVAFPTFGLHPELKSDLAGQEVSIGGAYRVSDKLRVGAAWRVAIFNASFTSAAITTPTALGGARLLEVIELKDLKDTEYTGFRLGAQYQIQDNWDVGLSVRNEVRINAKGRSRGRFEFSGNKGSLVGDDVSVVTYFPMQVSLGTSYEFVPKAWRGFFAYEWTQYSRVDALHIHGAVTPDGALASAGRSDIPDVSLQDHDQQNFRLAAEYVAWSWPVRFGYVYSTGAENEGYAMAIFPAPGPAHVLTVGSGTTLMDKRLALDFAGEYETISAQVDRPIASDTKVGDYATTGWAAHLGATYTF